MGRKLQDTFDYSKNSRSRWLRHIKFRHPGITLKKNTTFKTWQNFEIKYLLHVWAPVSTLHQPMIYLSRSIWTRDPFGSRKLRQTFVYMLRARCRWIRACNWGGSPLHNCEGKGKGHPATGLNRPQGVPGWLRPQIFLTFSTTRVVGRQPQALAAFTPGEIPGTYFQRLSQPQDTWFCQSHGKNPQWHHRESIPGPSN